MNPITDKLNVDNLILLALQEDISSEDVTTNSVMREYQKGTAQLICKQDGIVAGMDVFKRVFELLDENTEVSIYVKDGQSYFTFRSDCASTTDNRIVDPIVMIYTSNIHCNYAHSIVSQWLYFYSDEENTEEVY